MVNNTEEKVSIIIPVYNASSQLRQSVKSIQDQSYKNLEIILVNDGSTDKSLDICHELACEDHRIMVISKQNEGVSAARNSGLAIATGDYITFADSDDYLDPNAYAYSVEQMKEYDLDILKYSYIKESKKSRNPYTYRTVVEQVLSPDEIPLKNIFDSKDFESVWSMMVRKSVIAEQTIRFDESLTVAEDYKFMIDCLNHSNRVLFTNKPFYHYMINQNSLTQRYDLAHILERFKSIVYSYSYGYEIYGLDFSSENEYISKVVGMLEDKLAIIAANESYRDYVHALDCIRSNQDLNSKVDLLGDSFLDSSKSKYLKLKIKNILKNTVKRIVR